MSRKKKKIGAVEIRVAIDGLDIVALSSKHSADLDRLLEQRGAESFVFIPLANLKRRRHRVIDKLKDPARRRAKLPEGDWYDGELRNPADGGTVPGVFAFDIRRRKAREIIATLGVKQFFWGTAGAPVEQHAVKIFEDDDAHTWSAMRRRAFDGLKDMVLSARNLAELPTAVKESQTNMQQFWRLVALVLIIAIAAGAIQAIAFALLGSGNSTTWLVSIIKGLFYPFVIPAVLVGIYLRVLVQKGEEDGRDFTAGEAEENWDKVAPHLLALWILCWHAVLLLTWAQSAPSADLPFLGRTNGIMTSFIVCVWMLLPIANSRDVETLLGSAFESAITAAVSIFTIKLSLYLTNLFTDAMWGVLTALVPFDIPEWLQGLISFFINFGAELFFIAVLLGYAWSRTRQQFMRL